MFPSFVSSDRNGQATWFSAGRASSFPDIQPLTDDGPTDPAVSMPKPCPFTGAQAGGCKVFHIVVEPGGPQATEISLDDVYQKEDTLALKDQVMVFRYKGKFHAVDHKCPHMSYPLSCASLFDIEDFGIVLSAGITCPKHGWSFDIFTGLGDRGNYRLNVWEVQLRDFLEGNGAVDKEVWVRKRTRS